MNSTTEYCAPCDLPFAAQNQTKVEAESCPVCFNEEGLRKINGCGHLICGDCETNLKRTPGQFKETLGLSVKYIKCPLCRQTEKKTYEQLEAEVIYYRDRAPINGYQPTTPSLEEEIQRSNERLATLIALRDRRILEQERLARVQLNTAQREAGTLARRLADIQVRREQLLARTDNPILREHIQNETDQEQVNVMNAERRAARQATDTPPAAAQRPRRIRCSGDGYGCTTVAFTQRRCPTHVDTPCCQRCVRCPVCRGLV
jgi:hypothetical protein